MARMSNSDLKSDSTKNSLPNKKMPKFFEQTLSQAWFSVEQTDFEDNAQEPIKPK